MSCAWIVFSRGHRVGSGCWPAGRCPLYVLFKYFADDSLHIWIARFLVLGFVVVAASCGTSSRRASEESDGGASTDSDTHPSLVWTFGNEDYDITVPRRLADHQRWDTLPALTLNDGYLALPIGSLPETDGSDWSTRMIVFPEREPWNVLIGEHMEGCGYSPATRRSLRAFPGEGGFLLLATAQRYLDDWCRLSASLWTFDAEIVGVSHGYDSSQWEDEQVFPSGFVEDDGSVVTGTLLYDDSLGAGEDPMVVFGLDRFGPDPDDHGLIFQNSYSWSQHAEYTDSIHSSIAGTNTFHWNGEVTAVGLGSLDLVPGEEGVEYLVLARGNTSCQVTKEPEIFHSVPTSYSDDKPVHYEWSLAQREGTFLLLENAIWDSSDDPQYNLEMAISSYVFSMDGNLEGGPVSLLTTHSSTTYGDSEGNLMPPMAAWGGSYFGVCLYDPASTYKFMLIDQDGKMLKEPAPIFWDIPAAMFYPHACDIVALDDHSFAIVVTAASEEGSPSEPGVWVAYVDAEPVE